MAWVYKAYEAALDRHVALKVLQPETPGPTFAERFRREAKVIARLEHRHIVPIHAFGVDEGVPWMAMRLLTGGTLSTLLARGPVERSRVVAILRECAEALDHAHGQGILHRDVKPQNILLDQDGHVYLVDFGIAKLVEDSVVLTRTGVVAGTPHYMSPEQAQAENVDHRGDIYSLGIIAYELLTGRVPFTADSSIAVLLKHVSAPVPVPPPSEVPPRLCVPVLKALAKKPEDRWPTASAFVAALEAALAEPESTGTPTVEIDLASETPTTEMPALSAEPAPEAASPAAPAPPPGPPAETAEASAAPPPPPGAVPAPAPTVPAAPTPPPAGGEALAPQGRPGPEAAVTRPTTRRGRSLPVALVVAGSVLAVVIAALGYRITRQAATSPTAPATLPASAAPSVSPGAATAPAAAAPSPASPAPRPGTSSGATPLAPPAPEGASVAAARTSPVDGLDYMRIPPGTFQMGCVPGDACDADEQPRHPVTLGRAFWIGRSEVTVAAYKRFAAATTRTMPAAPTFDVGWRDDEHPMVNVTWDDARSFCEWSGGRLPTEAEWEYAARGGREGAVYPWGDTISHEQANYEGTQGRDRWANTSPAGSFPPNGFGLYDMSGNVWEWTADWYGDAYYGAAPPSDPKGPASGKARVVRGGSCLTKQRTLRASARPWLGPTERYNALGFRCVRDAAP
jgi:serine/threonine-protein kinase